MRALPAVSGALSMPFSKARPRMILPTYFVDSFAGTSPPLGGTSCPPSSALIMTRMKLIWTVSPGTSGAFLGRAQAIPAQAHRPNVSGFGRLDGRGDDFLRLGGQHLAHQRPGKLNDPFGPTRRVSALSFHEFRGLKSFSAHACRRIKPTQKTDADYPGRA